MSEDRTFDHLITQAHDSPNPNPLDIDLQIFLPPDIYNPYDAKVIALRQKYICGAFIDKKTHSCEITFLPVAIKDTSELEMYFSTLWISESTFSILMPIFLYILDVYLIYCNPLTANQFLLTLIRFQSHEKDHFTQWQFQEGKNFFVWV